MTQGSYFKGAPKQNNKNSIKILNHLLSALEGFKDNYTKQFNFSKLMEHLKVPKTEIEHFLYLLLNFQETFTDAFKNYQLKKKIENGILYLITKKKENGNRIPATIFIERTNLLLFSDVIYLFKFVKRGKGFDLKSNGSDLLHKVNVLQQDYPYFFEIRDNGLIYPSELGIKLGDLILSYNKSNKLFDTIKIDNYTIKVIDDE